MISAPLFGRNHYVALLEKRVMGLKDGYRQNLAIIGDEMVGKTSIVMHFLRTYCDRSTVLIYIENRPESLASFAQRFAGVFLYSFLAGSDIPLKEDLDFLLDKSSRFIPRTVENIRAILAAVGKKKKLNIFTELLSLCDSLYNETGKCSVIIFDEFHHLEHLGVKELYAEWSKALIMHTHTLFVLVSSMKYKARSIIAKNLTLLFGNFEMVTVEPFDISTAEEYLGYRLKGAMANPGLRNFLVSLTGGSPFYMSVICDVSVAAATMPCDITEVLERLLFDEAGILYQRFSNYLKQFNDTPLSQDYIAILLAIANGHTKVKDIAHVTHKPLKDVLQRAAYLLERDVVVRSGDFLKITDHMFGFWLKFVYEERLQAFSFDTVAQKQVFYQKMGDIIVDSLAIARKPIRERVTELLRLFADDVIQIERKRLRLSEFREIKPLEFNSEHIKHGLIGRSTDSLWILAFKSDAVKEEDIVDFARECKKYRHKLQRKIIIALQQVDDNARLRALEEKIWTWDVNSINHIMDLFSKPRVVA